MVVAWALSRTEKVVAIKMAPGSGKTYTIIKLIHSIKLQGSTKRFVILTCSRHLQT